MTNRINNFFCVMIALGLLTAGNAFAQQQGSDQGWHKGPPSIEDKLARMSDALGLSNEQSVDLLLVLQEAEEGRQALHQQTMAIMGPEICAQRQQTEDAILEVLTPEQEELFHQMKEERKEQAGNRERDRRRQRDLDCSD